MKTSFLAVAAGLAAMSSAQILNMNDISDRSTVETAFSAVGLSTTPNKQIVGGGPTAHHPKVKAFGWDSTLDASVNDALTSTDENWNMEVGFNIDIGAYYELPVYNQDNYLVFRQRLGVYAGGRQYISFLLGNIFRLSLFGDVWLAKVNFWDNYLRVDIVNYNDWCNAMQYIIDVLRFEFLFQLDVNECSWGLVGQVTDSTQDCTWTSYYINHPLFEWNPVYKGLSGFMYPNKCGHVPPYDA